MIFCLNSSTKCQLLSWTLLLFAPCCIYACAAVFFDATVFSVNKDLYNVSLIVDGDQFRRTLAYSDSHPMHHYFV